MAFAFPKVKHALEATEKLTERLARSLASMVALGISKCSTGYLWSFWELLARRCNGSTKDKDCSSSVPNISSPFQPGNADNKGINPHRCSMEYVKEINGLDSVADLYQGPESNYNNELGYIFVCATPRAREVFPVCLKSSPAVGLIFIPMVYYKAFVRLCDAEELVILPEY